MKRPSSTSDRQLTTNDDEIYQTLSRKMARYSPSQSRYNYEEKTTHRTQQISLDQCVVRQDLLYSLDGIFFIIRNV